MVASGRVIRSGKISKSREYPGFWILGVGHLGGLPCRAVLIPNARDGSYSQDRFLLRWLDFIGDADVLRLSLNWVNQDIPMQYVHSADSDGNIN